MTVVGTLLASGQQNAGTGFTTASVSPAPYALQILTINASRGSSTNPTAPTTLTGNGLTWVLISTLNYDLSGVGRGAAWVYRAMVAAPSSGTLVVSGMGTDANTGITYHWCQFTGVKASGTNGADAVRQVVNSAASTSDTPSVTLAAFGTADNATFGYAAGRGNGVGTNTTAGSGFTQLETRYQGSLQTIYSGVEWRNDNDTSVDFGFTFTNAGLGGGMLCGIEIVAAIVQAISATLSIDIAATAAFEAVTPGIPLGPTALDIGVNVTASIVLRRPNYRRPRREFLWISGYDGEQICAIS